MIWKTLTAIFIIVVLPWLLQDCYGWFPVLAEWLVKRAVRFVPMAHRQRYEDEWLAELDTLKGRNLSVLIKALIVATRILIQAPNTARVLRGSAKTRVGLSPPTPTRRRLLDGSWGMTQDSLDFFYEHRRDFGQFVEALCFFDERDARSNEFYEVLGRDGQALATQHTTGLILRDTNGAELWLSGCTCGYGGQGPAGSLEVLRTEGFKEEALEAITKYRVVYLRRDSPIPIVAKSSSFEGHRVTS